MKKTLVSIFSFIICLSIIGCTKEDNKNSTVDKKTVVWRIAAMGNNKEFADDMVNVWEKTLNQLLKEKNVSYQVKIVPFSIEDKNTQITDLKTLQKEGKQTDIISFLPEVDYDLTQYNNTYAYAVENKLLLNLDGWKEKNIKELEKSLTPYDFDLSTIDNQLFGISSNVPIMEGTTYDKQLLDQYGIDVEKISSNLFDNTSILNQVKQITQSIPIKYLPLNSTLSALWLVPTTNNLSWIKDKGFISLSNSMEYKEMLSQWLTLNKQGLFNQNPNEQSNQSLLIHHGNTISKKDKFEVNKQNVSSSQASTNDKMIIIPDQSKPNMELYWGDNKSGIASWSKNVDNAEDFLLKLFTDKDIANLIQFGIKDKDYILDENNHITVTTNNTGLKYSGYQFTNPKITYSTEFEEDDKVAYSSWFYTKYGDNFPAGFRFNPIPVVDEIIATNKILSTGFVNLSDAESKWTQQITKLDIPDLDAFLINLNKALDDAGMQKIVDEANSQYQQWLSKTK